MEVDDQNAGPPNASMADWLFQRLNHLAAIKGETSAQIFADDGSSWTFEKLFQSSVHVAAGLKDVGINPEDMVSVVARNTHELYAVALGCLMTGVTITPTIPELQPNELMQNFLVVNPQIVIAGAPYISTVNEAIAEINPKPKVFEIQKLYRDASAKSENVDSNAFKPVHISEPKSHIFSYMFSSGTTGKQKAIGMTDYGFLRSMFLGSKNLITDIEGPGFNASQMHWVSWWFIIVRSLIKGWTRLFIDDSSTVKILDAIHKHKVSIIFGSPITAAAMANEVDANPGRWNLSSLLVFIMGGDICNKFTHEDFMKKLKVKIYQEYGSTESGVVVQDRIDYPVVYGSAGKPLVPMKLVDLTTRKQIAEPNKTGEIVVEWMVFRHYINNPDATADSLDENGWLKMGDIAYFDESGNYFVVDRSKEIFKCLGYQIAPNEIEDIIKTLPGVKDVAVTGKFAGHDVGNIPTAFVVKSEDSNITEKDIHDHLETFKLHDSKRLRGGVIFKDEIPRNVNGKIVRAKLCAFFQENPLNTH